MVIVAFRVGFKRVLEPSVQKLFRPCISLGIIILVLNSIGNAPAIALGLRSASQYDIYSGNSFQTYSDKVNRFVSYTFTLANGSSDDFLVKDIGRSGPGIRLVKTKNWSRSRDIKAHSSIDVSISFHVDDCVLVPKNFWPVTLDIYSASTKWHRVTLGLLTAGSRQWQSYLVEAVCG